MVQNFHSYTVIGPQLEIDKVSWGVPQARESQQGTSPFKIKSTGNFPDQDKVINKMHGALSHRPSLDKVNWVLLPDLDKISGALFHLRDRDRDEVNRGLRPSKSA